MKICSIVGCNNALAAKGFCNKHYQRQKYHGDPDYIQKREERLCSVIDCKRKYDARGYCATHYSNAKKRGDFKEPIKGYESRASIIRECLVDDCDRPLYAKGYCFKHYSLNKKNGVPVSKFKILKKCKAEGCNNTITVVSRAGFCKHHFTRYKNNTPFERPFGVSGELNHWWKGGIAQYPNHYQMKKNRLIILAVANYTCSFCGKSANEIHHKDLSRNNHSLDNLVACCRKCNSKRQKKHKLHSSKYTELYGHSLSEIARNLGNSPVTVRRWHNKGILKEKLEVL